MRRPQYIRAQYQHSTRNGNLSSNRLKKYPLNRLVFGVVTCLLTPQAPTVLIRYLGSWLGSKDGELELDSTSPSSINRSVSLSRGFLPVSRSSTPSEILRTSLGLLFRPGLGSRLIHVLPNNKVTTTRGSAIAPIPPILPRRQQGVPLDVTERR